MRAVPLAPLLYGLGRQASQANERYHGPLLEANATLHRTILSKLQRIYLRPELNANSREIFRVNTPFMADEPPLLHVLRSGFAREPRKVGDRDRHAESKERQRHQNELGKESALNLFSASSCRLLLGGALDRAPLA